MPGDLEHPALCDLAVANTIYDWATPYNDSLRRLKKKTGNWLDLSNDKHCKYLLDWLNDWGCRHLSKRYREAAAAAIQDWHREAGRRLLGRGKAVWDLDDQDISGGLRYMAP